MSRISATNVRFLLKVGAGFLVSRGMVDQSLTEAVVALGMGLFSYFWGLKHADSANKAEDDAAFAKSNPTEDLALRK